MSLRAARELTPPAWSRDAQDMLHTLVAELLVKVSSRAAAQNNKVAKALGWRVINFKPAKAVIRIAARRARVTSNPTCEMSWVK
jgi:hypothetical protein